jgi:hypothetical protein
MPVITLLTPPFHQLFMVKHPPTEEKTGKSKEPMKEISSFKWPSDDLTASWASSQSMP